MRLLKIFAVVLFIGCLILHFWATAEFNAKNNTEGPTLSCPDKPLHISVKDGNAALLQGLQAQDAQDGDLTSKIMVASTSYFLEPGVFDVDYVVFDSHSNSATATRRVCYTDYVPPRFQLSAPLVFTRGSNIRYLNYVTAVDAVDGDLTGKIKVRASNVSNYTPGVYPVLLEVSNSYGDVTTVELSVTVLDRVSNGPTLVLKEYLSYVRAGDPFDPYSLLLSVTEADGTVLDSADVDVLGTVDTDVPGCYQLIYSCEGAKGEGRTYLTVVVTDREA